jgi:hypothetical protein
MQTLSKTMDEADARADAPSFVKASVGFVTSTVVLSTVMVLLGSI